MARNCGDGVVSGAMRMRNAIRDLADAAPVLEAFFKPQLDAEAEVKRVSLPVALPPLFCAAGAA